MNEQMIIAVDGPAGAGKSTVCKLLAAQLGYAYLDTGAMYRAVAWALLRSGIDAGDAAQVARVLPRLPIRFAIESGALKIYYREAPLEADLRSPEISSLASGISQAKPVRTFLTQWQRQLSRQGNVVAEGRDMGTVVFPEAQVKVYLTADLPSRTKRRLAEYRQKGVDVEYSVLEKQIRARDEADRGRDLAPLRPAPGALILDTSDLTIPEALDRLLAHISEKSHKD